MIRRAARRRARVDAAVAAYRQWHTPIPDAVATRVRPTSCEHLRLVS